MAKYHKITGNESVGTIAEMYGVTPQTLLAANPGVSTLSAGAYLRVPSLGNWNGTNPLGGAGANQPKMLPPKKEAGFSNPAQNPWDKVMNVFKGIGDTLSNIKFKPDSTLGGTRQPYPLYSQNGTQTPTTQQNGNLNAQQVAELNLANASSWKPSWATSTWNENLSNGNPTPVTPDVFQELVFIRQNGGVPRDASIQIVNSALVAQGYVYNPITKRYDPGGPTGGSAPKTQDNTENGRFSKDSWENYKQKTIARGGKRWWIGKGKTHGENAAITPVDGSNAVTGSGQADSIWRIG